MAAITNLMTGADFDALPYDEDRRWELLDGKPIALCNPTPRHQRIVGSILVALIEYLDQRIVAGLALTRLEFALSENDRLRPDVCVLLGDNAARLDWDRSPIPGAPDIAIEVISPGDLAGECHSRVLTYLRKGTTEVWEVHPELRIVGTHRGNGGRTIEDGDVTIDSLPGFALTLATIFD